MVSPSAEHPPVALRAAVGLGLCAVAFGLTRALFTFSPTVAAVVCAIFSIGAWPTFKKREGQELLDRSTLRFAITAGLFLGAVAAVLVEMMARG